MPWTELYFESQYLVGVICCVLVLAIVIIALVVGAVKKLVGKIKELITRRKRNEPRN